MQDLELNLMFHFSLDIKTKGWLFSSIIVLLVNLVVFGFRKHFDPVLVLWVVFLTPLVWLILYFLFFILFERLFQGRNFSSKIIL